jgi:hypothetical protein
MTVVGSAWSGRPLACPNTVLHYRIADLTGMPRKYSVFT